MEKNRKPRINPLNIYIQIVIDKGAKRAKGESIIFVTELEKVDNHTQRNEIGPLSYTTHKN